VLLFILEAAMDHFGKWRFAHPGVSLEQWVNMLGAIDALQSDWAYANGPLALPPKYDGQCGYWLD